MQIGINCDMGESFSLYRMGNDEALMPLIDQANIACGFHASDPNHMRRTVALAKKHGVAVGAHVSLPDLAGFGRREMKIEREELTNIILYQIGALTAFCRLEGASLAHLKPHGALYGMAARYEHVAEAVADAAVVYNIPVMGMVGTKHETVYRRRGIDLQAEFFADLDYDDDGSLIITREHAPVPPREAAERVRSVISDGVISSRNGKRLEIRADTICIHSDTPNAAEIARAVREAVHALSA
jgi:5-oxoprolinase (ATP-hydrolysing) subunit A